MMRPLLAALLFCLAPYLHANDVDVVRLQDLEKRFQAGGDTTFVVNLWATWCKPCVAELPWFEKLHREAQSTRPITVLLVSLDTPAMLQSVERFVAKKGISASVLVLNEAKPHTWIDRIDSTWSGAIPATLIVQDGGRTRHFFEREFTYQELRTTLSTVMGTKP